MIYSLFMVIEFTCTSEDAQISNLILVIKALSIRSLKCPSNLIFYNNKHFACESNLICLKLLKIIYLPGLWRMFFREPHLDVTWLRSIFLVTICTCVNHIKCA